MSDAATRAAWAAARYRVWVPHGVIDTRIGTPNAAMSALLKAHGVDTASLVTPCNPFGRPLAEAANRRRLATLRAELLQAGYTLLDAEGGADDRSWVEPSLWVPALAGARCRDLMRRHEQLAWVEYDARGIGRLCESGLYGEHGGMA